MNLVERLDKVLDKAHVADDVRRELEKVIYDIEDLGFGIFDGPCYFCESKTIIGFDEHWTFCSNCRSIYTNMITQEKHCDHFSDSAIVVEVEPASACVKGTKPYITTDNWCSECGAHARADGW